jgi:cytochrome c oxidase cbb3-type subunit I/II
MLYWMLPRIFQTKLWSPKLAEWHFWVGTVGILLYIVPIYVAGLTQGLMWRAITPTGQLAYPDFVETVKALQPLYWTRVLGGVFYVSGIGLLAANYVMTWRTRPAVYADPAYRALPLSAQYVDPPEPESDLKDAPVLECAKSLDVWSKLAWHRRWERLPIRFTVYTTIAVVIASLFEFIPTFLIRSNVPTMSTVKPYTPLELAGRDIYVGEGCYNCHSQMIRPILAETKRYGEYSKPGEFIYDRPFQWGSRRIGPDLAREGGKQSHLWHLMHLLEPTNTTPGSIMPAYAHLAEEKLNFKGIPDRVQAAAYLGAPYKNELTDSEAMARAQAKLIADDIVKQGGRTGLGDKQVVAVIAYLQRIGTDLFAPPPPAQPSPTSEPGSAEKPQAAGMEGAPRG